MGTLASGLTEIVAGEESLARFLTSSSHYNSKMVKPAVFMPEPNGRETSVFRHGHEPRAELWAIAMDYAAQGRNVHGAALLKAHDVRATGLEVVSDEPPSRHAAIRQWPWNENDDEKRKAHHKELAILLASKSDLVLK
jgi:hypothetical protein